MKKYDELDDNEDNDGNENGNDNDNAADGSGSDCQIFYPITMPRSCLSLVEEDWETTVMAIRPRHIVYLCLGPASEYISTL